jgi:hypothetical protein
MHQRDRRQYSTPLLPAQIKEIQWQDSKAGSMLYGNMATTALIQRRALLDHCAAIHLLLARCMPYIERGHSQAASELLEEINSVLVGPKQAPVGGEQSKDGMV